MVIYNQSNGFVCVCNKLAWADNFADVVNLILICQSDFNLSQDCTEGHVIIYRRDDPFQSYNHVLSKPPPPPDPATDCYASISLESQASKSLRSPSAMYSKAAKKKQKKTKKTCTFNFLALKSMLSYFRASSINTNNGIDLKYGWKPIIADQSLSMPTNARYKTLVTG